MLMHCIKGTFVIGQHHPVILTGYKNTPLIAFAAYRPVVLVADHTQKIVNVVSVPLDEDNVGHEKVLTMPFGVTRLPPLAGEANQQLLVTIYPNPYTDIGSIPVIAPTAWAQVRLSQESMNMMRPVLVQTPVAAVAPSNDVDIEMVDGNQAQEEHMEAKPKVVVIYSGTQELPQSTTFLQADVVIKAMTTHAVSSTRRNMAIYRIRATICQVAKVLI
ncbi:hypothetical protein MHU86_4992 [Fragilaria crotonensis]|nr:hypothetical protein MHU86_4992 [Fragilaria crotonensis]